MRIGVDVDIRERARVRLKVRELTGNSEYGMKDINPITWSISNPTTLEVLHVSLLLGNDDSTNTTHL